MLDRVVSAAAIQLSDVCFHNGGYCVQSKYLSGAKGLRPRKFHAVFVSFSHPTHGNCLIDSGYGPAIFDATKRLPFRVLRWVTPISRRQDFMKPNYLDRQGIDPQQIDRVFISHFHADHIGAVRLFAASKFVFREASHDQLQTMSKPQQFHNGFLPELLPDDFLSRAQSIHEAQFAIDHNRFPHFASLDYWGDGSLVLIDLPGHALGHTGYLMQTTDGPKLYVVDAFWDREAFNANRKLPWISQHVLDSYTQYQATNQSLRAIAKDLQLEPLACHCPRTQEKILQSGR